MADTTPPVPALWRTILTDSIGLVAVIWAIPVAILLVGAPIVLAVALAMAVVRML
jgi:hypothetical protein